MELVVANCREYVLGKLALCGELSSKGIANGIPYSTNYVLREVKQMRDENLIRYYRYRDGRRFYRLNDPAGTGELEKFNDELALHFSLMAGEHGSRYKGDRSIRLKQRRSYELHALFQELGYEIDGLILNKTGAGIYEKETLSVFSAEGVVKDIEQILRERDASIPSFLSSKALRNYDTENVSLHPRDQMYRASGVLLKGRTQYAVYAISEASEVWWPDVERQFSYQLQRLGRRNLKAFARGGNDVRLKALIYVPDSETLFDLLAGEAKKKLNPSDVYALSYYIPLKENAGDVTEMLLIDNWKQKLNSLLAAKKADIDSIEDGYMPDGSGMFNLLCCNSKFMQYAAGRIRTTKATVIIHDWQEKTARNLYGDEIEYIVIDSQAFRILLEAVKMGVTKK